MRRRFFPHFVANKKDELHFFSDGVFHQCCFRADPRVSRVARIVDQIVSGRANCTVCGAAIVEPSDFFAVGLLTSDENDSLRR